MLSRLLAITKAARAYPSHSRLYYKLSNLFFAPFYLLALVLKAGRWVLNNPVEESIKAGMSPLLQGLS